MTTRACDREHDFTLVLSGIADLTPEVERLFFEAGCDVLRLVCRSGRPFLTFPERPLAERLRSLGIGDVKKANIGAESSVSMFAILSRKANREEDRGALANWWFQYIMASVSRPFPPPVCNVSDDADSPLWLLVRGC